MSKKLYHISSTFLSNVHVRCVIAVLLVTLWIYIISTRSIPNPDVIACTFVLIAIIINRGKQFLKDWWFLFAVFFMYEVVRGHALIIHNVFSITVHKTILLEAEQFIFGERIPTLIFQQFTSINTNYLDVIAVLTYLSFFVIVILVGFLIWLKNKPLFSEFKWAFLVLCISALITYIFFPAYPPWLASQEGYLPPLIRNSWENLQIGQWATLVFQTVGYNPVAPMPSLHAAWAFLASYYLDRLLCIKYKYISKFSYIYILIMSFVIIYTGDHYVVDILAGIIYSIIAIQISKNRHSIHKKLNACLKHSNID